MSNRSKHFNKTERAVPLRLRFYPQFPHGRAPTESSRHQDKAGLTCAHGSLSALLFLCNLYLTIATKPAVSIGTNGVSAFQRQVDSCSSSYEEEKDLSWLTVGLLEESSETWYSSQSSRLLPFERFQQFLHSSSICSSDCWGGGEPSQSAPLETFSSC